MASNSPYYFNGDATKDGYIFFYDEITIKEIKEITGRTNIVFNNGEIKDYELVFGGNYPKLNGAISNIVEKPRSNVYGIFANLDRESLLKIEQYYLEQFNKPVNFIIIYDTNGNRYKGFAHYFKGPQVQLEWTVPPSINILNEIYKKHIEISKNKLLYIYDVQFNKKGLFNGKSYDTIDDKKSRIGVTQMKEFKLKNPNPFQQRMVERDTPLFMNKEYDSDGNLIKETKYKEYSRTCAWNERRQPVILTQEEKDFIDKEYPGSYDDAIQYSTNPKMNKYYYICPRYWNLRDNVPVKPEDVDKSVLINANADPGKVDLTKQYIFEFRKKKTKYSKKIPGFLDQVAHPKKYFMPCCYGLGDKKRLKNLKEAAEQMKNIESLDTTNQSEIEKHVELKYRDKTKQLLKTQTKQYDNYIKQGLSFPLSINRYGELPFSLAKFLDFDNRSCYRNEKDKKLKLDKPCLFRAGIENNVNKSYLAAISYIFNKTPNNLIQDIIDKINTRITVDNILNFQKGNIPNIFYKNEQLEEVDLEKYKDTEIYKINK